MIDSEDSFRRGVAKDKDLMRWGIDRQLERSVDMYDVYEKALQGKLALQLDSNFAWYLL